MHHHKAGLPAGVMQDPAMTDLSVVKCHSFDVQQPGGTANLQHAATSQHHLQLHTTTHIASSQAVTTSKSIRATVGKKRGAGGVAVAGGTGLDLEKLSKHVSEQSLLHLHHLTSVVLPHGAVRR